MEGSQQSIAVIGGGAAGLVAAIAAARLARQRGCALSVAVYEKDDRVGRSILATGNGRCNFSNAFLAVDLYHNSDFVEQVFQALAEQSAQDDPVHRFFEELGLVWRQEADGRQFPLANKASVVLDVLRSAAADLQVAECCDFSVAAIEPPRAPGKPFALRMDNGVLKRAQRVILASGGRTVSALDVPEVPRLAPKPVLGPLSVSKHDRALTQELDNIRVKARVSLLREGCASPLAVEEGELMFRKYGLSGICIFNLSRFACPGDTLCIDFLAEATDDPQAFLDQRRCLLGSHRQAPLTYVDLLCGLLLPRVSEALLRSRFINPYSRVEAKDIPPLTELLSAYPLQVEAVADPNLCQVRRGGFSVEAFCPESLEAKGVPGLFSCGEALDVDGPCGGYNLHWAWSSGLLAGTCAASSLLGRQGA